MNNKKVYVGLSGGVDSAVSAALLQKEGYDVTGVFITIKVPGYPCPAAEDRVSAMRVAAHLDIAFREVNLSKEYEEEVFRPSIEEWRKGKTPNPDTLCNEKIKFGIFFNWCIAQGADYVATGHYAQVNNSSAEPSLARALRGARPSLTLTTGSSAELYMAVDPNKDQTYFLWAVKEALLQKTLFPIGGLQKPQVRELARKFKLPNADRPDSQGLCFLGDIALDDMLVQELELKPGKVLDEEGREIGTHMGAVRYTLGQRHGFELQAAGPDTEPHFVIAKDVVANTLTVSTGRMPKGKTRTQIVLRDTNWIGQVSNGAYMARFRYRQKLIPATLAKNGERCTVTLDEPHFVPEGQSLVLYEGERCLGGGIIESATLEG